MAYLTVQQMIDAKIINDNLVIQSKMIKDLIDTDRNSTRKKEMNEGEAYFNSRHDILDAKQYYFLNNQKIEDNSKANNKVVHPFHKLLVEQKAGYIAGNPIAISYDEKLPETEVKVLDEKLMDLLTDSFDDMMNSWIVGASNKSEEWIHFFIDSLGKLNYLIIDARELIPIYDTQYQKNLVGVIRYYSVEEIIDNIKKTITKVEWWTSKDVSYYTETSAGDFIADVDYKNNPSAHFYNYNTANKDLKNAGSWNKVPFVKLANNAYGTNDLKPIKILIDAYDKVKSGWINNLDDFQELVLVLKGYAGVITPQQRQSGYSELDAFFQNLKTKKVIPVDDEGSVDQLKLDIPYEARDKFLEITRKEIFYFGQGIDVNNDTFGNAPSGTSLKFVYALLDLKANQLIRKMTLALSELMYFFVYWINLTEKKQFDAKVISYVFNKSIIFNEKEKIDSLNASVGVLSEQTILENHPLVSDVQEELLRLETQREKEAAELASTFVNNNPDPFTKDKPETGV